MTASTSSVNCVTDCVNGCILGDQCPHREAAQTAVTYIMNTDWDTLMEKAESRFTNPDPMAMLEQYERKGNNE